MDAENRKMTDLKTIVYNALVSVEYSGQTDNKRLLSAIQDLATGYPLERKAFLNVVDSAVLQMCSGAMKDSGKQRAAVKTRISKYLQQEYWIAEDSAKAIANTLVDAFVLYGCGLRSVNERDGAEASGEKRAALRDVVDETVLQICIEAAVCGDEQRPAVKKRASRYLQREYYVDNDYANDIAEVLTDAFTLCGRQRIIVDKEYIAMGEWESAEVTLDADIDLNEWYYAFDYDENRLSVVWEDEDDKDNLTVLISKVGSRLPGTIRIYCADADGNEIRFVKPAFVEIY